MTYLNSEIRLCQANIKNCLNKPYLSYLVKLAIGESGCIPSTHENSVYIFFKSLSEQHFQLTNDKYMEELAFKVAVAYRALLLKKHYVIVCWCGC